METNQAYWNRIEARQKSSDVLADSTAAREASPVTIQIPQTGQQMFLERNYIQPGAEATARIDYLSDDLFGSVDLGVTLAAVIFVGAFWYAVRRLRMWIEVLLVTSFLVMEVMLDLVSADLARDFLRAGIGTVLILGAGSLLWRLRARLSPNRVQVEA